MSIELRCPGCQNLLRVPDTAAGKQARCPQCQQIVDVPAANAAPPSPFADAPETTTPPAPFSPAATLPSESFAGASPPPTFPHKAPDASNPYAASGFYEQPEKGFSTFPMTHQQVSFDDVIQTTWTVFQLHIGPLAVVGVFVFGINMLQQALGFAVNFSTALIDPTINAIASLGLNIVNLLVTPIITLGTTIPCLILLRTGNTVPGDFMKFTRFYGTELLKVFLLGLLAVPLFMVAVAPIGALVAMKQPEAAIILGIVIGVVVFVLFVFLFMSFYLSTAFIVDRGAGAIESLKLSWQFMNRNRGTAFLLSLVVGLAGGLFACCTLGFGAVLLTPFISLMCTVLYLTATGQRSTISPQALGPQAPDVPKVGLPTDL